MAAGTDAATATTTTAADMHTHPEPEQWLPVPGYEGEYEASSLGRVRSLDRYVDAGGGRQRISRGRVLKPVRANYFKVDLSRKKFNLHVVVALTFLGPRPEGMEVCHNNGDRWDCRPANLRYDTHAANQLDTVLLGVHQWAGRDACSNGHEYVGDNFRWYTVDGHPRRVCRRCEEDRGRARRAAV